MFIYQQNSLSIDPSLNKSIFLFLISFSNTFSAISGGGAGLLQLPALILSGVPYYQALASHKLATVALGIGGSLRNYKSLGNDMNIAWQILTLGCQELFLGLLQLNLFQNNTCTFRNNFNIIGHL